MSAGLVAGVCRRIEDHQIRYGESPVNMTVTADEYKSCMYAINSLRGNNNIDYTNLKVMGVPIELGPVSYLWGCFPSDG